MSPDQDDRPRPASADVTGTSVVAVIFSVMGLAGWCPCIGSIVGIVLGRAERNDVGRAAVILGWIGLALQALVVTTLAVGLILIWIVEHA